jgi:hypothetical protein
MHSPVVATSGEREGGTKPSGVCQQRPAPGRGARPSRPAPARDVALSRGRGTGGAARSDEDLGGG